MIVKVKGIYYKMVVKMIWEVEVASMVDIYTHICDHNTPSAAQIIEQAPAGINDGCSRQS